MTSAPPVTPQRIRAARLLKQLNDVDALPTERAVLDLAQLDPDAPPPVAWSDERRRPLGPTSARPASA